MKKDSQQTVPENKSTNLWATFNLQFKVLHKTLMTECIATTVLWPLPQEWFVDSVSGMSVFIGGWGSTYHMYVTLLMDIRTTFSRIWEQKQYILLHS